MLRSEAPLNAAPGGNHASRSRPGSVVVAFTVPMIMVVSLAMFIAMTLFLTSAVHLTVAWHVLFVVPAILHEIDRLPAGVVLVAVLAPVLLMARTYVQVNRLACYARWRTLDNDWLSVDQLRLREIADIDAAIEAGLADLDGYADICG